MIQTDEHKGMKEFTASDKHFLYCDEHQGLVPIKDIDFSTGEITGHEFPECKLHPHATYKVYSTEQVKKKFGFTMFEDRGHLR